MRKISSRRMLALTCLFYLGANMAHPFTPTLFTNLGLPDYMFGVAYACMSVMGFIMGPFWGKSSDAVGKVRIMSLGCFGYALGQFFFSQATTVLRVILARLFSGIFCNATIICALAYIADNADEPERSKLLAWQAAFSAFFGAGGYLLGGILGDIWIPLAFGVQIGILLLTGILIALLLADKATGAAKLPLLDVLTQSNPFRVFLGSRQILTRGLLLLFISAATAALATTCFDNAFNYYIKAEFDFPATYNGVIKAGVGIIGFIANMTLCMHLIQKTKTEWTLTIIYAASSLFIGLALKAKTIPLFVTVCIVYYILNSLYVPIQQYLVMQHATLINSGTISGLFNSIRSIGTVTGSLTAGFLYSLGSRIPFAVALLFFLITAVIGLIGAQSQEKEL